VFKDEEYDKERSALPEMVEDAVLKGLEASCSSTKRKTDDKCKIPKKRPKLWLDNELDEDISSSDSESEELGTKDRPAMSSTHSESESCSSSDVAKIEVNEASNETQLNSAAGDHIGQEISSSTTPDNAESEDNSSQTTTEMTSKQQEN